MNTEELKMVLDTIQQLGDQGTAAFVLYVVFDSLLTFIGLMIAVAIAYKLIVRGLEHSETEECIKHLRKKLRAGVPGCLTSGEIEAVKARVDELVAAESRRNE